MVTYTHGATNSSSGSPAISEDAYTQVQAVHEVMANQAVAGSNLFAVMLAARWFAAGVVLIFQLVGNGTTLGQAVALPQVEDRGQGASTLAVASPSSSSAAAAPSPSAGPLPPLLMDYLLRFLVTAANQLHTKGIVNLDVKTANTMLTSQGQPVMSDLGAAVMLGTIVSGVGTPLYCAPQVREGRREGRLSLCVWQGEHMWGTCEVSGA
jgi:hypothetical protein